MSARPRRGPGTWCAPCCGGRRGWVRPRRRPSSTSCPSPRLRGEAGRGARQRGRCPPPRPPPPRGGGGGWGGGRRPPAPPPPRPPPSPPPPPPPPRRRR